MESERKIEKLLRAYAKKRRAQAGDPLKLHPAIRRLFQGEVARSTSKPDEEDSSLTLWELFRQRWAWLAGFALIVFFGVSLFLPALSKEKFKAQQSSAMSNLKQIGMAAQMVAGDNDGKLPATLDALTNQLGSDKLLTDAESGKRFIYIAGGENLNDLPSDSVIAYSPTDKKGRAVLFADGRVERINGAEFSELTNHRMPELAFANASLRGQLTEAPARAKDASGSVIAAPPISEQPTIGENRNELNLDVSRTAATNVGVVAANAPAASETTVDQFATAPGLTGNYYKTPANSAQFGSAASQKSALSQQNIFRNTVAKAKTVSVLANFQVQQNGSAIRVVDADGSVYDGSLQPQGAVATGEPVPAIPPASTIAESAQTDQEKLLTRRDKLQTAQNYFFRVRGMNQTLKQNVVFAGSLLPNSISMSNLQQSSSVSVGGGQSQLVLTNQLPWSNSRITGTAVISDTNNIEINAVPLSP